jgi:hypothetical protein
MTEPVGERFTKFCEYTPKNFAAAAALEAAIAKSEDSVWLAAADAAVIEKRADDCPASLAELCKHITTVEELEAVRKGLAAAAEALDTAAVLEIHNAVLDEIRAKDPKLPKGEVHARALKDPRVVRALAAEQERKQEHARAVTKETTPVNTMTNTIEPDTVEFAKNAVVRDLILPAVEKMQRPGETLADAAFRWRHDAQDAPLLMKAAGFEAVDKARPVDALRIDQKPRQVGDREATYVNDPAAAVAETKALVEQARMIRPSMTIAEAERHVEQLRLAVRGANAGRSPRGSSAPRL